MFWRKYKTFDLLCSCCSQMSQIFCRSCIFNLCKTPKVTIFSTCQHFGTYLENFTTPMQFIWNENKYLYTNPNCFYYCYFPEQGGGAEAYAELHPLYESEKTQPSGSYATEERQRPNAWGTALKSSIVVLETKILYTVVIFIHLLTNCWIWGFWC